MMYQRDFHDGHFKLLKNTPKLGQSRACLGAFTKQFSTVFINSSENSLPEQFSNVARTKVCLGT